MPEVSSVVVDLVTEAVGQPVAEVVPTTRFGELPGWGSLSALRLLAALEARLAVRLDLREYLAIQDVGGLVNAVTVVLARGQVGT
ncbi:phosphopantetheine-binding protein [Amycolatopsis mediterranei]|uniref:phosphopantetheine-binding protein n=1 Tax=Amycolatopsis mediterranei TaxID=33910 RepID=UPI0034287172